MTPNPIDIAELRRLIQDYLELGGLFNPELMKHDLVRDMIMSVRPLLDEVERLRAVAGATKSPP